MQFTPKTEKELSEARFLPAGIYPFEVIESADGLSKKKKPMITLKLNVFGKNRSQHVYDYISDAFMEHKLRHFCFCVGLGSAYESGTLTARQCLSRQGYVEITFEDGKDGFKDKNTVVDYIPAASEVAPEPPPEPSIDPSAVGSDVPVGDPVKAPVPVTRATDAQLKGEEPLDDVPF